MASSLVRVDRHVLLPRHQPAAISICCERLFTHTQSSCMEQQKYGIHHESAKLRLPTPAHNRPQRAAQPRNTTTALSKGALFFDPPNFSLPLMKRISPFIE